MRELRNRLKQEQSYLIEKDLIPKLYFKEDKENTEYWVFFYAFVRKLTDLSISVRLGYSQQAISKKVHKILKNNKTLIETFLDN